MTYVKSENDGSGGQSTGGQGEELERQGNRRVIKFFTLNKF